jgi:hypothetical protein
MLLITLNNSAPSNDEVTNMIGRMTTGNAPEHRHGKVRVVLPEFKELY